MLIDSVNGAYEVVLPSTNQLIAANPCWTDTVRRARRGPSLSAECIPSSSVYFHGHVPLAALINTEKIG